MKLTEQDQRVLQELGLKGLKDEEKETILALLDERLEKRFLANLLVSLPADKQKELEEKVEAMPEPDAGAVIEEVLKLHPDAKGILEKSAREIIEEVKQDKTAGLPAGAGAEHLASPTAYDEQDHTPADGLWRSHIHQPTINKQQASPTSDNQPVTGNGQPEAQAEEKSPPPATPSSRPEALGPKLNFLPPNNDYYQP